MKLVCVICIVIAILSNNGTDGININFCHDLIVWKKSLCAYFIGTTEEKETIYDFIHTGVTYINVDTIEFDVNIYDVIGNTYDYCGQSVIITLSRVDVFFNKTTNLEYAKEAIWYLPKLPEYQLDQVQLRLDRQHYFYTDLNSTSVQLDEIYRIKNGPVIERPFMVWNNNKGFKYLVKDTTTWKRRKNLQGIHLTAVGAVSVPQLDFDYNNTTREMSNISGFFEIRL
jgi:hypothetical protein